MPLKEQQFNLIVEYFKSLRDEIHLRIKEHSHLVWIKIVSLGVVISFFCSMSLPDHLSCLVWIIPLAAIVFDMLIAGNLRVINNLGYYIKKYIENADFTKFKEEINLYKVPDRKEKKTLLDWITHPLSLLTSRISSQMRKSDETESESKFKFWEEAAAQAELKYHCYTVEDLVGIWLFTAGSFLFSLLFRWEHLKSVDTILTIICATGTIFAFIYLIGSITMKRRF